MKRLLTCLLVFILLQTMTACKPQAPATADQPPVVSPDSQTLQVTVENQSSFIFNALYVSPTAANDWGRDHLGSTNILKSGGSFDITLEKYQYANYDIRIIDEEKDTYLFTYVPLIAGSVVTISFGETDLIASVLAPGGEEETIIGELQLASSGSDGENSGEYTDDSSDYTEDSSIYDEDFSFTIYNESDYDIIAIYLSPETSTEDSVDVLPAIMGPGESQAVTGSVAGTQYAGISTQLRALTPG